MSVGGMNSTNATVEKRRPSKACSVCRARKTRCDTQRPKCGFCSAHQRNCVYPDVSTPLGGDMRSLVLGRLDRLEAAFFGNVTPVQVEQPTSWGFSPEESHSTDGTGHDTTALRSDSTLHENGKHDTGDLPLPTEVIQFASASTVEAILQWPIFKAVEPSMTEITKTPTVEFLAHASDSQRRLTSTVSHVTEGIPNLDFESMNALINNFVEFNHNKNPILDIEKLRHDAYLLAETGPRWDGTSCLILLACAIGAISSPLHITRGDGQPYPDNIELEKAERYFQASQRRMGNLCHQTSLPTVQCSFLTGVYLMMTMRILAAWKAFAQAGTQYVAYSCASSADDEGSPLPDRPSRRSTADSLYWSCLKSELELRLELSLPGSGLNERKYPHLFPALPESLSPQQVLPRGDPEFAAADPARRTPSSTTGLQDQLDSENSWLFYLAEIALRRITNRALSMGYNADSTHQQSFSILSTNSKLQALEDRTLEIDTQIHRWLDNLPRAMIFPLDAAQNTNDVLKFILRGHMIDIIEITRFPAVQALLTSQLPLELDAIPRVCLAMAKEGLVNAVYRIESNAEGFLHRHQGTWLTIRSCTRSALVLLAAALLCNLAGSRPGPASLKDEILPPRWREAVHLHLEFLSIWAEDSHDVTHLQKIVGILVSHV